MLVSFLNNQPRALKILKKYHLHLSEGGMIKQRNHWKYVLESLPILRMFANFSAVCLFLTFNVFGKESLLLGLQAMAFLPNLVIVCLILFSVIIDGYQISANPGLYDRMSNRNLDELNSILENSATAGLVSTWISYVESYRYLVNADLIMIRELDTIELLGYSTKGGSK